MDELEGFRVQSKSHDDDEQAESNALSVRMHKLRKKIHPDQIEEMEGMDEGTLRRRIAQCECNILESEQAKAADADLKLLKDKVREANAPYTEVKKTQRAIAEYAACLLDAKGVL